MQSGSSGTRCTRKHSQAADVARADRAQLLVGPRQATRCAVHHLACPGPACVPVGAREVAEADVLRQRAAAGRATRRRAGSAMNCAAPVEHEWEGGAATGVLRAQRRARWGGIRAGGSRSAARYHARIARLRGCRARAPRAVAPHAGSKCGRRPHNAAPAAAQAQDLLRAGLVFLPCGGRDRWICSSKCQLIALGRRKATGNIISPL